MRPFAFQFDSDTPGDRDGLTPWIASLTAAPDQSDKAPKCERCGNRPVRYIGPGLAYGISGGYWADIIGAGSGILNGPNWMVTDRVLHDLRSMNATGFTAFPVVVAGVLDRRLQKLPRPKYFYLSIHGSIAIDWKRSGMNEPCSDCGAALKAQIRPPQKIYPAESSWDKSDIFMGRPHGSPYCTLRVLESARQHRWSNFRFYAIDETRDGLIGRDGIDYLGKQWPPAWYADSPSFGKSADEWLEEYFSITFDGQDDYLRFQIAARALDDLGEQVLPELTIRFGKGSQRAAHAILSMSQRGTIVPQDLLDAAQQAYWSEQAKVNPHLFIRDPSGLWHPK